MELAIIAELSVGISCSAHLLGANGSTRRWHTMSSNAPVANTPVVRALVDLYMATNGAAWSRNDNWLTGEPCGDGQDPSTVWYGLDCTALPPPPHRPPAPPADPGRGDEALRVMESLQTGTLVFAATMGACGLGLGWFICLKTASYRERHMCMYGNSMACFFIAGSGLAACAIAYQAVAAVTTEERSESLRTSTLLCLGLFVATAVAAVCDSALRPRAQRHSSHVNSLARVDSACHYDSRRGRVRATSAACTAIANRPAGARPSSGSASTPPSSLSSSLSAAW